MRSEFRQELLELGYKQEWEQQKYIFTRRGAVDCYVVMLIDALDDVPELIRQRTMLENYYLQQNYQHVFQLCILCCPDGLFSDKNLAYVNEVQNLWLLASDQNRVYCFEHQPVEFDGIREAIEKIPVRKITGSMAHKHGFYIPWVTIGLIVVNLFCFLYPLVTGKQQEWIVSGRLFWQNVLEDGQWYRLITCIFLHGGISHLYNNMISLLVLGFILERTLKPWKYLVIYLLSGIGGAVVSMLFPPYDVGSIGASGAIFGLMGALLAMVLYYKGQVPGVSKRSVIIMCAVSLVNGFFTVRVDNAGHIGGIITGFLLLIIMNFAEDYYKNRKS